MTGSVAAWFKTGPSDPCIKIRMIEPFDARGMRRVYGRKDQFKFRLTFNMNIWKDREGHIYVRFWSHRYEVDWESYEILGSSVWDCGPSFDEDSVPQVLREEYDNWILSNF